MGAIVRGLGITGVEIAPTTIWNDPSVADQRSRAALKTYWDDAGCPIVALQALLYGRPDLQLFATKTERINTLSYLEQLVELAAELGAGAMVFGSPRNRVRGHLTTEAADDIAIPFFQAVGNVAEGTGVTFCIEPNPPVYGCDYLTTTAEVVSLLERIDHPSVGINLDAGAIAINDEDPESAVEIAEPWLGHFHISEPELVPIADGSSPHAGLAAALDRAGYERWRSIEMRASQDGSDPATFLRPSVTAALLAYADHE